MSCLIPALDSGSDRTDDDGHVQRPGVLPLVRELDAEVFLLLIGELLEGLEAGGVLGDEGAALQHIGGLFQAVFGGEARDIVHQLVAGNVGQRVLDPGWRRERERSQPPPPTTRLRGGGRSLLGVEVLVQVDMGQIAAALSRHGIAVVGRRLDLLVRHGFPECMCESVGRMVWEEAGGREASTRTCPNIYIHR